jgi:hypothetical protein
MDQVCLFLGAKVKTKDNRIWFVFEENVHSTTGLRFWIELEDGYCDSYTIDGFVYNDGRKTDMDIETILDE